eukprot:6141130-Heterocapsa_arctica.AAC.1
MHELPCHPRRSCVAPFAFVFSDTSPSGLCTERREVVVEALIRACLDVHTHLHHPGVGGYVR